MSEESHAEKTGKIVGAVHGAVLGTIILAIWHFRGRDAWADTPSAILTIFIVPFCVSFDATAGGVFFRAAGERGLTSRLAIGAMLGAVVGLVLGVIREGPNAQLIIMILGAAFGFTLGAGVGVLLMVFLSHVIGNSQTKGN